MGGERDRTSRPTSKLSRTLPRGARGTATREREAQAAELTVQLWAVSPEAAPPPRPPRQGPRHDRVHQRIIAARDISADTLPAQGRGGGDDRLALQWAAWTCWPWHCAHRLVAGAGTPSLAGSLRPLGGAMPLSQPGLIRRAPLPRPGSPDPRRAQCPSPAAWAPLSPHPALQPRAAPSPRTSGALAAAGELWSAPHHHHPGGAGDSPAPWANPGAPAAALQPPLTPPRARPRGASTLFPGQCPLALLGSGSGVGAPGPHVLLARGCWG